MQENSTKHAPSALAIRVIDAFVAEHNGLRVLGENAKRNDLTGKVSRFNFAKKIQVLDLPLGIDKWDFWAFIKSTQV